jgi:hypothetical protein
MTPYRSERILVLDVHPLRFGFVALEGPHCVLDWGVRSFRRGVNAVKVPMSKKLELLLDEYDPKVIVVGESTPRVSRRMKTIAKLAANRHLPMFIVKRETIRIPFPHSIQNKHQIAQALGDRYPELSPIVPPKRKSWKPEHYRMDIFNAAALGVAYFASEHAG